MHSDSHPPTRKEAGLQPLLEERPVGVEQSGVTCGGDPWTGGRAALHSNRSPTHLDRVGGSGFRNGSSPLLGPTEMESDEERDDAESRALRVVQHAPMLILLHGSHVSPPDMGGPAKRPLRVWLGGG